MANDMDDPGCSSVGRRAGRLEPGDFFAAVAIADRLSALLRANAARKARRARGSLSAPIIVLHPDLRARNWQSGPRDTRETGRRAMCEGRSAETAPRFKDRSPHRPRGALDRQRRPAALDHTMRTG